MWNRNKDKKKPEAGNGRSPESESAGTVPDTPPEDVPTAPLRRDRADPSTAPTAPNRGARESDGDATLVHGGPSLDATSDVDTEPDPKRDTNQPRPAEADAPTVAIRPEYQRTLPEVEAPVWEGKDKDEAEVSGGDETVMVKPSPNQAGDAPGGPTGDTAEAPPAADPAPPGLDEPTMPMGRRRKK